MWGQDTSFDDSEISTSSSNGQTICTLTLDEDTYNETASNGGAVVFITVTAKDSQDLYLNDETYNDGSLHFTTSIDFVLDWSFDPEEGTVEKLDSITVTCESGIALSYYGNITITKDDETLTGISIECEEVEPEGQWDPYTQCVIKFMDESTQEAVSLTDAGTYVITIDEAYFNVGDDGTNPEVVLTYIIEDNSGEEPTASAYECYFTDASTATSDFYTITKDGNYSNSHGTANYNDTEYTWCLKMDSYASIEFTISEEMVLTLVFADDSTPDVYINDDLVSPQTGETVITTTLQSGSYTIKKGDNTSTFLFYINLASTSSDGDSTGINSANAVLQSTGDNVYYNLNGQRVSTPSKGIYILNGKKILIK